MLKPFLSYFSGSIAIVVVITVVFLVGRHYGVTAEALSCEKKDRRSLNAVIEKVNKIAIANEKVATAHVATVVQLEKVYSKIEDKTNEYLQNHPVNTACDIGDDGLQLWNKANAEATRAGR